MLRGLRFHKCGSSPSTQRTQERPRPSQRPASAQVPGTAIPGPIWSVGAGSFAQTLSPPDFLQFPHDPVYSEPQACSYCSGFLPTPVLPISPHPTGSWMDPPPSHLPSISPAPVSLLCPWWIAATLVPSSVPAAPAPRSTGVRETRLAKGHTLGLGFLCATGHPTRC